MRLWSIHPKYLDSRGLVAFWRETLLAKKVLQNKTKGYKNHPQLERFTNHPLPISLINSYLHEIYKESQNRKYNFDQRKIGKLLKHEKIPVTSDQITYEFRHLLKKLHERDLLRFKKYNELKNIELNPIFKKVSGPVENWEKIKSS